jgi:hypothetical protein
MKPGTKLKSAVDDTEVMVIKGSGVQVDCGGAPMSEAKPDTPGEIDPDFAGGTLIGKRYVDEGGSIELLCVKGGKGSLSVGGQKLAIKDAKPLPASD